MGLLAWRPSGVIARSESKKFGQTANRSMTPICVARAIGVFSSN